MIWVMLYCGVSVSFCEILCICLIMILVCSLLLDLLGMNEISCRFGWVLVVISCVLCLVVVGLLCLSMCLVRCSVIVCLFSLVGL